jgi:NAD(P)-dependent dehydrogenase (short-subunit alcohol dehydrogenase family)
MGDEVQEFRGRTVLVTGAGKGIGRATAKLLASRGASILALSRTAGDLASLEAEIGCGSIVANLADLRNLVAIVQEARPYDLLVNCAGTTALDPFVDLTLETFDHIMTINTKAPMLLAQDYARRRIAANLPGSIVNVSSDASFLGVVDQLRVQSGARRAHPRDGCRAWRVRHTCELGQSEYHHDGYGPKSLERSGARRASPCAHGDRALSGSRRDRRDHRVPVV